MTHDFLLLTFDSRFFGFDIIPSFEDAVHRHGEDVVGAISEVAEVSTMDQGGVLGAKMVADAFGLDLKA